MSIKDVWLDDQYLDDTCLENNVRRQSFQQRIIRIRTLSIRYSIVRVLIVRVLIVRVLIVRVLVSMILMSSMFCILISLSIASSVASIDVYQFQSTEQERQYRRLIDEFRCPKCQNQNLAGSDAPIAQDLKQKTYDMVQAGNSDAQIRDYMLIRYGDFISYKPPVRPSTYVLWFFPPLLLMIAIGIWVWKHRHRNSQYRAHLAVDDMNTEAERKTVSDHLSEQEQKQLAKILASTTSTTSTISSTSTSAKDFQRQQQETTEN